MVLVEIAVQPNSVGMLNNQARVVGAVFDPDLANNVATEVTSILEGQRKVYLPLVIKD